MARLKQSYKLIVFITPIDLYYQIGQRRSVEIDQIETFLAVLSHGGFHRAASVLHISQPAVSTRIQVLEDSLGVRLFDRTPSGLLLSAAGKALRPHAEEILRSVAVARQAVHDLQPASAGMLRIGAALSICTYFLPDVMKEYHTTNPKVMVSLRSGNSMEVLKMVLDGEVDIGMARSLNHPGVETTTLRDDPLILVSHPQHPAARKRRVTLEQVEAMPLIFYDRGSSDWTLSQGLFRRAGLLPNVILEVESIEAAKRMVERKLGLSFLPQMAVSQELAKGKLTAIHITNTEPLRRNLDVIHPRHRPMSKEAHSFFLLLRRASIASLRPGRHRIRHPIADRHMRK